MRFYNKHILPKMVSYACSLKPVMRQRERVVPLAKGRVLEVGLGTGLNLPFYDASKVSKVWGLEPSAEMIERAKKDVHSAGFEVELLCSPGEDIPLETDSADTILVTYTLCTIFDVDLAIKEMARVLKPSGELIFCEHGAAPDLSIRRLQNFINPVWKRLGGGCHLNREIPKLIEQGGFEINTMKARYIPGWRPGSFNYWGTASVKP